MLDRRKSERRQSNRRRSFLRGSVRDLDRGVVVACIIRDISETGAKLRFKSPMQFNGDVELHFSGTNEAVRAKAVWHDHCEVGLAFDAVIDLGMKANEESLAERVNRLEAELIALKQVIAR